MTPTWVLRSSLWLPLPPGELFPFFADPGNLAAITPPWLRFRIRTPLPIVMRRDAVIDYALRIRGVPVRWRTRIAWYDPPSGFADEQLRGPYRRWFHVHSFTPCDGGTEVADRVELTPPGGPLAPLVFRWFVRRDLLATFSHRARALAARFGGDPGAARIWFEPPAGAAPRAGAPALACADVVAQRSHPRT